MEMKQARKKEKAISIFRLFLEHLVGFSLAVVILALVAVIGGFITLKSGIVYPANYSEQVLMKAEDALSEEFDEKLLPPYTRYILFHDIEISDTNMNDAEIRKTKKYLGNGSKSYYVFYKVIPQKDGNTLIVQYDMLVHFRNPSIHRMIPYPEFLLIVGSFALLILFAAMTALKFSKKLKKNLIPIVTATENIKDQNLEFEIEPTEIAEFNDSLEAIDQLKNALTDSLNQQWKNEQKKKEQLCALAHDIKTPLTVIKGNAELLLEEELSLENRELITYMKMSSDTIGKYVELLMNALNQETLSVSMEHIAAEAFLEAVTTQAMALCKRKSLQFKVRNSLKSDFIYIDAELLKRALVNVIDNAVRYSDDGGTIEMNIWEDDTNVMFEIKDYGSGFSAESLERATEEFYTEDASRADHHYGLGLNFAMRVARMHHGMLNMENEIEGKGARVVITIAKSDSGLTNP